MEAIAPLRSAELRGAHFAENNDKLMACHAKLAAASEVWWTGLDNVKTGAIATFQRLQAAYAGFCAAEKELFPGGFLA